MVQDHILELYYAPITLVFPASLPQLLYGRLDLALSSVYIFYVSDCFVHLIQRLQRRLRQRQIFFVDLISTNISVICKVITPSGFLLLTLAVDQCKFTPTNINNKKIKNGRRIFLGRIYRKQMCRAWTCAEHGLAIFIQLENERGVATHLFKYRNMYKTILLLNYIVGNS